MGVKPPSVTSWILDFDDDIALRTSRKGQIQQKVENRSTNKATGLKIKSKKTEHDQQ